MKKWQTKAMLLSAGLVLATTGTVALADQSGSTSTGLEVTGTPVTLQAAAGGTDLNFEAVRLAELAKGPVTREVTLPKGTFTVTNYTGMEQSWSLVAGITNFQQSLVGTKFDGHLTINGQELHVAEDGSLVGSATIAHDTMAFSDYTWESPEMKVSLTIPPTVSIGTYNATIQYELQNGVVNPG
ncbi:hypothetical protein ACAW68_08570 [Weissella confusa]|uniref:WxL domain-containing protein n=1 Tax=Weissella confusa TaxID=1583 RepID=A0A4Z0RYD2_WEICO|nr:hypothetical protein [Weissella confusa]TGE74426.1 hypothetical protein C6P11_03000 [Weissella confusa]